MRTSLYQDQRGLAPVLLAVIGIFVIGVIGIAGWQVMKEDDPATKAMKEAIAACNQDDEDLCKFLASWKENEYYTIKSTTESEGQTSTYTAQHVLSGEKTYMKSEGSGTNYEMISIGNTTYTKDQTDGAWFKQTIPETEATESTDDTTVDFEDPETTEAEDKTVYKKLGKEACGEFTCFKYQVIDPALKDETQYIWFDDDEYQLRRMSTESPDGKSDMTFSYEKVTIKEPSPVKEMPTVDPNAGMSEAEMQQLMEQYGAQ